MNTVVKTRYMVMVWIPSGAFESGTSSTSWYDGSHFARDGIVCVTNNYRVNAEGFLYLGEGNANRGLLDQIAAQQVCEHLASTWFHKLDGRRGLDWRTCGRLWSRLGA
jgi:carboxylesterase type B